MRGNAKYLSIAIQTHRHKKYTSYTNDLKTDYIIDLLTTTPKYRKYAHKAMAEEAGFKTTQHFVRAFTNRTGKSPIQYIDSKFYPQK